MTKREDRSIRANLARHDWLMAQYMAEGMSREDASKRAFKELSDTAQSKANRTALAKVK